MLGALAVIPGLIGLLGTERFGLLSLFWIVGGYFSILDLGLGRAVTISTAELAAKGAPVSARFGVTGTALVCLLTLGAVVTVCIAFVILFDMVGLPLSTVELAEEAKIAFLVLLPTVPLQLASAAIRGHLEGIGAFRLLNLIRAPFGVLLLIGPYLCAQVDTHLVWASLSILLVRLIYFGALVRALALTEQIGFCATLAIVQRHSERRVLIGLLRVGGWISLSSALGPIVIYTDRFVIALFLGGTAVAAYSVPFDLIARFPFLVASACSVLLPALIHATAFTVQDEKAGETWMRTFRYATSATIVFSFGGVALGWFILPHFMMWWVGPEFSANTVDIARYLLVAFAINAVAQVPLTGLQAMRDTRIVAMIHLFEVGPYLLLLFWAVEHHGVAGAAVACIVRAIVDCLLLTSAYRRRFAKHLPIGLSWRSK